MSKIIQNKKTTNEKPISLFPLQFKEVMVALFKIKPPLKEKKPSKKKKLKVKVID
jgi:hypothetical protein